MKKDSKVKQERSKTGVPGLDDILSGGLIPSELLAIASVTGRCERIATADSKRDRRVLIIQYPRSRELRVQPAINTLSTLFPREKLSY
jgi:hypothetical protein